MNLFIDDDIKDFILYMKQKYNELKGLDSSEYHPATPSYSPEDTKGLHVSHTIEPEFEIRLTETRLKTHSISEELFKKLFELCSRQKTFVKSDTIRSIVNIYKRQIGTLANQYREIVTYKDKEYKQIVSTECQIKTKSEHKDRMYDQLGLRYSFSREQSINCPSDDSELVKKRYRQRIEFDTKKGYKYVLTLVNDKIKLFEFEIEYELDKVDDMIVQTSLSFISSIFKSNVPLLETKCVSDTVFPLLKKINPPKPVNMIDDETVSEQLKKYYYVTNKLDGERYLLYIHQGTIYSIQNDRITIIDKIDSKLTCLVDSEYFQGKYYLFDCYVYDGSQQDVYTLPLPTRLEYATKVAGQYNRFVMKQFSNVLLDTTIRLLDTLKMEDNDGLIYTPLNIKMPVYKWKFPEKMSIDFRVVKDGDHYNLCVYTERDQIGTTPFKINQTYATYETKEPLQDGKIYEFMYQHGKFVMSRLRPDKVKPNFIKVAQNVWKDIMNPFEAYKLINMFKPLRKMRRYHNFLKTKLIKQYCHQTSVLDLGIGAGGDLGKYYKEQVSELIGVEPYDKNYNEFIKRLSDHPDPSFQQKVKLVKTTAQNTKDIVKAVGIDGVNVVSSFFSLSFFFFQDHPEYIDQLCQTISQNLQESGYFIGTTIDGKRTSDLLKTNNVFDFGEGSIKNENGNIIFSIKGTIVETQTESLVNFELLTKKLEQMGIRLVTTSFFPENKDLDQNVNILNSLYRSFVFQKDKYKTIPPSDSIYDLITLSTDDKCFDLFEQVIAKKPVDTITIQPDQLYDMTNLFYLVHTELNPLDSMNLFKMYSLYGNRLYKKLIIDKLPKGAVPLKDYTVKEDYDAIRSQITDTLALLHKRHINYGSLDTLYVHKDNTGLVRVIFNDYSKTKKDDEFDDNEKLPLLLERFSV